MPFIATTSRICLANHSKRESGSTPCAITRAEIGRASCRERVYVMVDGIRDWSVTGSSDVCSSDLRHKEEGGFCARDPIRTPRRSKPEFRSRAQKPPSSLCLSLPRLLGFAWLTTRKENPVPRRARSRELRSEERRVGKECT